MVVVDSLPKVKKEHIKAAYTYLGDYYTCGFDIEYSSIEEVIPKAVKIFHCFYNDRCKLEAVYMVDGTFFMRRFNLNNETTYWLYWDATDVDKFRSRIV